MESNNKTLSVNGSSEFYVLLVEKMGIVKGVISLRKGCWFKGVIPCTIKPQDMLRFNTEKAALNWWNKNCDVDPELKFHKVVRVEVSYHLDMDGA